jgi:hypothetical protein
MIVGPVTGSEQSNTQVSPEERATRYAQQPATICLSGDQKASVATRLERRLFDGGHSCIVINDSMDTVVLAQIVSVLKNASQICLFTNLTEQQQSSADYCFSCEEGFDASAIVEQLIKDAVLK